MAEIDTTRTWLPGDSVDAAKMNEIIDQAIAEPAMISGKTTATPVASTDYVMFWDASDLSALKKCKMDAVTGVTNVAMTATPSGIFDVAVTNPTGAASIALSLDQQEDDANGQNTVLACPSNGTLGNPSFRALLPKDLTNPARNIPAFLVDCLLGTVFFKQIDMTGSHTLTLNNGITGQIFRVWVQRTAGSGTLNWSSDGSIRWPGGTVPVLTAGVNAVDIFTFVCVGAHSYYGTADHNFLL